MRKHFWFRVIAVWLLIALVESVHGTLRVLFLVPVIGDLPARQWGFVTACFLIMLIAWLTAPWLNADTRKRQWSAGAMWMVLMFAFEAGLGVAQGFSWERIMQEYDPRAGGLMALGML
ncbi:MAG: hypothetical protein ABI790_12890, partial [Betaproteobacteria bacterium]